MAKQVCLVLGANGFIGSHIVDSLVSAGYQVRAFDHFSDARHRFKASDKIEIINGDFFNHNDVVSALKGVAYVFHFISTTTPATVDNDPTLDFETNIKLSVELFQECVNQDVKKIIYPSSGGAIYGENSSENTTEDTLPAPVSPYAIGKLSVEHYLRYFRVKFGLESVVYRISNPYGAHQALNSKQGVIPIFLQLIKAGQPVTVLGDGSMVRDYIYVKDVVNMIVGSFKTAESPLYNIGGGHGTSINELLKIIKSVTGKQVQVKHKDKPATFVDEIVLNTDRFQTEFGIQPVVDMNEGIASLWDQIK